MVPGVPADNGSVPRISTNGSKGSSRKNNQQSSGRYTFALCHNITNSSSRDCIVIKSRPKGATAFLWKDRFPRTTSIRNLLQIIRVFIHLCVLRVRLSKRYLFSYFANRGMIYSEWECHWKITQQCSPVGYAFALCSRFLRSLVPNWYNWWPLPTGNGFCEKVGKFS